MPSLRSVFFYFSIKIKNKQTIKRSPESAVKASGKSVDERVSGARVELLVVGVVGVVFFFFCFKNMFHNF